MSDNNTQEITITSKDETLIALKERYFRIYRQEDYPHTKEITSKLDELEKVINLRKRELLKEKIT